MRKKGITYVECIISVSILTLGAMIIYSGLSMLTKTIIKSKENTRMAYVAKGYAEKYRQNLETVSTSDFGYIIDINTDTIVVHSTKLNLNYTLNFKRLQ